MIVSRAQISQLIYQESAKVAVYGITAEDVAVVGEVSHHLELAVLLTLQHHALTRHTVVLSRSCSKQLVGLACTNSYLLLVLVNGM